MSTIRRVFEAIAKDNLHTRREIASSLGCSFVTVSKAVDKLISCGLIASVDKNESDVGRRSDFLDISPSACVLLINLCGECLCYTISTLYDGSASARHLPYVDSLDFEDNFLLLIRDIKRRVITSPLKIAIALPGDFKDGKLINAYINDYSGFNIIKMIGDYGINADVVVSAATAVEASPSFLSGDAFVCISRSTWGTFGRGRIERLGKVTVDNRNLLDFDNAVCCSYDENSIMEYSSRLLGIIDSVLSPERILFSSKLMPDYKLNELASRSPKPIPVDDDEMILDGLMELAATDILGEI